LSRKFSNRAPGRQDPEGKHRDPEQQLVEQRVRAGQGSDQGAISNLVLSADVGRQVRQGFAASLWNAVRHRW
jgi:hypothetical protein